MSKQSVCRLHCTVTGILTTAVMAFVGYEAARQALYVVRRDFVSDALKFAAYPFIWLECICMVIFALVCLADAIQSAYAIFSPQMQDQLH